MSADGFIRFKNIIEIQHYEKSGVLQSCFFCFLKMEPPQLLEN